MSRTARLDATIALAAALGAATAAATLTRAPGAAAPARAAAAARDRQVYPGIDLLYYGRRDAFEFDFVVRPHGVPYTNVPGGIELQEEGVHALRHGSTSQSTAYGVAVDPQGRAYVAGLTLGDFITTPGAFQAGSQRGRDSFVAKVDPAASGAASLLWATHLGGTGFDETAVRNPMVAVDRSGSPTSPGVRRPGRPTAGPSRTRFPAAHVSDPPLRLRREAEPVRHGT